MGTRRVPWVNASLWSHSRSVFPHPKIVWLDRGCKAMPRTPTPGGNWPKHISKEDVFRKIRWFQGDVFWHVLLLSIFAKIDPVKSLVTQGHVKVIPLAVQTASTLIGNRTNLPQPFTLAYALPHRSEKCLHICRALRLLAKGTQKIWIHVVLCFTVRWVHRSVPWTEELFSTYGRARDQMYMWIFGHIFACLLSCLARNVNLWKIKFMGLTNCQ